MERSDRDKDIYSGSVTKLFLALLHSPSNQLKSSKHYVNKHPSGGENLTTSLIPISDTKLNVEYLSS